MQDVHLSIETSRRTLRRLVTIASNSEADPYLIDEIEGGRDFLKEAVIFTATDDPDVLSENFGITFGLDEFERASLTVH